MTWAANAGGQWQSCSMINAVSSPRWTSSPPRGTCPVHPGRENAGLPAGTKPINVVSTLALMDYDDGPGGTYRMRLAATHPGVTVA